MANDLAHLVLAALAADSLALGAHWEYDTERIKKTFGRLDDLQDPIPGSYHTTKHAGQFTHYGDQTLVLLESVSARGGFDLDDFGRRWRKLFDGYQGYVDQATRDTLANFQAGKGPAESGSGSADLAGASRMAPVVWAHAHEPGALLAAARAQTKMTHDNPLVISASEFFARVALLALEGDSPPKALERAAAEHLTGSPLAELFQAGLASREADTTQALLGFGTACPINQSFPGTIHLLAKYSDDLEGGLVANVMCGGDSSGRGMITALVLAAHLGPDALPSRWVEGLEAKERIYDLLHLG